MRHINQNCGSSCGPTSLKMIMMEAGYKDNLGIQDIFGMSPTKIGGTPWPRMSNIISELGIKHKVMANVSLDYFKCINGITLKAVKPNFKLIFLLVMLQKLFANRLSNLRWLRFQPKDESNL